MKKRYLFALLVLVVGMPAFAQRARSGYKAAIERVAALYIDSLVHLNNHYNSEEWAYDRGDTLANPYYFPLFLSPTLYDAPVSEMMGLETASGEDYVLTEVAGINRALADAYVRYPNSFGTMQRDFMSEASLLDSPKDKAAAPAKLTEAAPVAVVPAAVVSEEAEIVVQKPNFWTFSGNYSLQFMQNYVSDNWYKGGESNYSMLGSVTLNAVYNNKQKVIFSNTLEMKLGFQSTRSDSIHKFKTTTDLIRLTNKLGLRATDHWYYTAMLQTWSQFSRGYKTNNPKVYSDILSPLQSLLSIGMNYKLEKKNLKLSVDISPLALNFTYVGRSSLISTFGLDEGKHTQFDFGSNITATAAWTLTKNVQWQTRLYCFTSYHKLQAEWENTFVFTINKYLSSKIFLYPRFDDSVTRTGDDSYFQFNEWLSLGLNIDF